MSWQFESSSTSTTGAPAGPASSQLPTAPTIYDDVGVCTSLPASDAPAPFSMPPSLARAMLDGADRPQEDISATESVPTVAAGAAASELTNLDAPVHQRDTTSPTSLLNELAAASAGFAKSIPAESAQRRRTGTATAKSAERRSTGTETARNEDRQLPTAATRLPGSGDPVQQHDGSTSGALQSSQPAVSRTGRQIKRKVAWTAEPEHRPCRPKTTVAGRSGGGIVNNNAAWQLPPNTYALGANQPVYMGAAAIPQVANQANMVQSRPRPKVRPALNTTKNRSKKKSALPDFPPIPIIALQENVSRRIASFWDVDRVRFVCDVDALCCPAV